MNINLKIWRQGSGATKGGLRAYRLENIDPNISFLEMLDILNIKLVKEKKDPVAFDHDCREEICGSCGFMINGRPHGPQKATTVCQLHMRAFNNEDNILLEPFRAESFPVIKDLSVDRKAFDRRIISSGGYVSTNTGEAPEANSITIEKEYADEAFLASACIGCGACVAACKNSSAMLFTSAKVSHLSLLPQGQEEGKNGLLKWWPLWMKRALAHVPTQEHAQQSVQKK